MDSKESQRILEILYKLQVRKNIFTDINGLTEI